MSNRGDSAPGTVELELRENGVYVTNTVGHSMEPFLSHHRDVVVISRPERELCKYDVVLYRTSSGDYVLHRIIKPREHDFIIRGDNNYFNECVPRDKIIGVLTSFVRNGKRGKVTDFGYRFYSRVRCASYPFRAAWRKLRSALGKAYRAIFKKHR